MLSKAVALRICRAGTLSVGLQRAILLPSVTGRYNIDQLRCHHLKKTTPSSSSSCWTTRTSSMSSSSTAVGAGAGAGAVPAPSSDGGGRGDQAKEEGVRDQKKALRKRIKSELKAMSEEAMSAASAAVAERLLAFPQLQQQQQHQEEEEEDKGKGQSGAVSVYMSMPGELGTTAVVSELFKRGRKIYIPKVLGAASANMRMFPPRSEEEVASFPLTKWKIREPPEELALSREDGVTEGDIDVVVVPGVAFDASCNRLGHGRGHYDCFFERVNKANTDKGRPRPITMAVCFDEQVVDCVPTEPCDVRLDFVLTPTRTFRSDGGVENSSTGNS